MRKYEIDVRDWVATGEISKDLYDSTRAMMASCLSSKFGYTHNFSEIEEYISETWISIQRVREKFLESEYAWSTFVYHSSTMTYHRQREKIQNSIPLPSAATSLMIKYDREINGGMTHGEFINRLAKGEYGDVYTSEESFEIVKRTWIQKVASTNSIVFGTVGNKLKLEDTIQDKKSLEEDVCNLLLSERIKHMLEQYVYKKSGKLRSPNYVSCLRLRVIPMLLGQPYLSFNEIAINHGTGTRQRIQQVFVSIVNQIRKDEELKKLIKEYRNL